MKKEKIYNFLLFILIFLAILSVILLRPLNDLDELWNYNFARNVANGLVPYKDFNMLQMPLLPLICGLILKITTNQLIVMRVMASLLCSVILYIIYRVFSILNIKRETSIIFILLIWCLFYNLFCIDYNFATLLLALLIIYKEIKIYKKDSHFLKQDLKSDLILGVLAGLTVTLKQTTGLFICIALLGNKLLFVRKKEEFRIYLRSFAFRLIGILIPLSVMIIYLLLNNTLGDFISYTIKGVFGFSNYVPYTNLIHFNIIGILSILVPIAFIYTWIKTICFEKDKILYILLVYGLAMFIVCFPISDKIHFLIGTLPTIILILYEMYNLLNKICDRFFKSTKMNNTIILATCVTCIIILIYYLIINFYNYSNNNYSTQNYYKYIPISKEFEQQINNINNYVNSSNKDIKILDATAAVYMIPNNKYNKNYDMLLKGNLGYDGENRIIEEIKNSNNTQYLILKDKYIKNWQTPLEIIEYVKKNKTMVGQIEIFDIYE